MCTLIIANYSICDAVCSVLFWSLNKKEKETAQEYMQAKVIDVAKEKIFHHSKSISEIAYELGFKYPQYFARLFKQRVGQSPNEFRLFN